MSFSGKVKEELAGQLSLARHCQVAELAALLCGENLLAVWKKCRMETENYGSRQKMKQLQEKALHYCEKPLI